MFTELTKARPSAGSTSVDQSEEIQWKPTIAGIPSGSIPTCFSWKPKPLAARIATPTPISGAGSRGDQRAVIIAKITTLAPSTNGAIWVPPMRPSTRKTCVSGGGAALENHHRPADSARESGDHGLRNFLNKPA